MRVRTTTMKTVSGEDMDEGEDDHYEDSGEDMDEDNDYEDRCEDMDKEDDNDHSMQTVVTINNCMWPWSRHKLICMVLHIA